MKFHDKLIKSIYKQYYSCLIREKEIDRIVLVKNYTSYSNHFASSSVMQYKMYMFRHWKTQHSLLRPGFMYVRVMLWMGEGCIIQEFAFHGS